MSQPRFTKTFVENRYWRRQPGPGRWQEVPRTETGEVSVDLQIREWVERTGYLIVHPGQLGLHTQWHDAELTLKCVTLGLTVLYVEEESLHGEQEQNPTAERVAAPGPERSRSYAADVTPNGGVAAAQSAAVTGSRASPEPY